MGHGPQLARVGREHSGRLDHLRHRAALVLGGLRDLVDGDRVGPGRLGDLRHRLHHPLRIAGLVVGLLEDLLRPGGRLPHGAANLLEGVKCREQVLWITMSSSGWFLEPVSAMNRVVITATQADAEPNETEFPWALVDVMQAPPAEVDCDGDQRISLVELFGKTVENVQQRYDADERAATEHALLDDNGDGRGTQWQQIRERIQQDPRYGKVVCRCEKVSEAEIVDAIQRGASTLDGVKFRTRAGMGRCQGNFCGPKSAGILARELDQPLEKTTKKGPGSGYVI